MKFRTFVLLIATGALLAAPRTARADAPPTDGAVADTLLARLLEPVVMVLDANPQAKGLALRRSGPAGLDAFQERIGNFLHDRGYEIWSIDPGAEVPEGALLLDFEVRAAGIDYPRRRGGFLGLGASSSLRRAALGISGRIEDPRDGQWLWRGSPLVQSEHWIRTREREELAADRPTWMSAVPLPPIEEGAGWWERALVAGLLAGVVLLYTDGAQ